MHDETLMLPMHGRLQLHASQYKPGTQHPSRHLRMHTSTPQGLKKLSLTTAATQQTFPQTPHNHYNRHKTKHALCTYIYCLATRGHNKILRTPPPRISSSEVILPRLTRRTLAQLITNKSPFLKSYLHKVDAKSHPSPLCPLCNTHTHDIHHILSCTHIRTTLSPLDFWTDPAGESALLARWTEKLAGGPQAGRSD